MRRVAKPGLLLSLFLAAGASSLCGYIIGGAAWPDGDIPIQLQFQSGGPSSSIVWNDVAQGALNQWNLHLISVQLDATKDSTVSKTGGNGLNNAYWANNVLGETLDSNVLGVTVQWISGAVFTECDVIINTGASGSWSAYSGAQKPDGVRDFKRVVAHEFGHVLGLTHPDKFGQAVVALMNSTISDLDAPAADDISGVKVLYDPRTAPLITQQPSDVTVVQGTPVVFAVSATSRIPYRYQWFKDGTQIPNAVSHDFTIYNAQLTDVGDYTVAITNAVGATTSRSARLALSLGIKSQPVDQIVVQGASAIFAVEVEAQPPVQYQWRRVGVAIPGATGATLTLPNVQLADEGDYTVAVTRGADLLVSRSVQLRIGLLVTEQPQSAMAAPGGSATFAVRVADASALFRRPVGLAIDSHRNMYISDGDAHVIRKISAAGVVSTFAGATDQPGFANGQGAAARFHNPHGLTVDAADNLFVVDRSNHTIRKVTPDGTVSSVAGDPTIYGGSSDGVGVNAHFSLPTDVVADAAGGLYVTDTGNSTIRRITGTGEVTTFAGKAGNEGALDGTGSGARFYSPTGIACDRDGNLFIADEAAGSVRKITPGAVVSTMTRPSGPSGSYYGQAPDLTVDAQNNLYVIAYYGTIYRLAAGTGPTVFAGEPGHHGTDDGPAAVARFNSPESILAAPDGNIYVPDTLNVTIRKISPDGIVTTFAGRARVSGTTNGTLASYQWQRNRVNIPGATAPVLTLTNLQIGDDAEYAVVVTNSIGTVTSAAATLSVRNGPTIQTQPLSRIVDDPLQVGIKFITFAVEAAGLGPFTYQWRADGIDLSGETGPTLTVANFTTQAKDYSVVVSNGAGSVTSQVATLTVGRDPPSIESQVGELKVARWGLIDLAVGVRGAYAMRFQWKKNGVAIPGATRPDFRLPNALPTDAGTYTLDAENVFGHVTSAPIRVSVDGVGPDDEPSKTPSVRLVNISTRGYCGLSDRVMIGGFVVSGTTPKRVLVRAVGPTLTTQGIRPTEVLVDPMIEVHRGIPVIASNDNWNDNANALDISRIGTDIGANPLAGDDTKSSALLLTLDPGVYSFVASGKNGASGIVLLEVYDASPATGTAAFVNIAARAYATTGDGVTIGGFVISGNSAKRVLLRAVGPTLVTQGIGQTDVLADPMIELHQGVPVVATNDNWRDNANAAEIVTTGARIGAAPFADSDTASSALLLTLQPGVYSFVAVGKSSTSGIVLVEVYDAD